MSGTGSYTITLDDDPQIHKLIARMTGLPSLPFTSPEKLLGRGRTYSPLAVYVDANLGIGISGIDFLCEFRSLWPFAPLFVITGETCHHIIGKALAKGAHDFIRKPLVTEEVLARLGARLSEVKERQSADDTKIGDLSLNVRLGTLKRGDKVVHLPPLEAELLVFLSRHLGLVTSKDAIRSHLWPGTKTCANALDKKISNLRKALSECAATLVLKTTYGGNVSLQIPQPSANGCKEVATTEN